MEATPTLEPTDGEKKYLSILERHSSSIPEYPGYSSVVAHKKSAYVNEEGVDPPPGDEKFSMLERRLTDVEHNVKKMCREQKHMRKQITRWQKDTTEKLDYLVSVVPGSATQEERYPSEKFPRRRSPSPHGNLSQL